MNREIRKFHIAVMQQLQRNVQKSMMHVQSFCFANLHVHLLLFFAILVSVTIVIAYAPYQPSKLRPF